MPDETPAPVVAIEEAVTNRTRWLYVHLCDALGVEPDPGAHHTSWDTAVGRVRIQAEALRAATARADAAEATVAAVTKYASEWKRRAERYEKALTSLQNRTAYAMPWQHPEVNDFVRGALSATEGNNILDTVVPLL